MNARTVKQILKFGIVGVINTGIDIAVLNVLILITGKGKTGIYFTFFKAFSFTVAVVNSYFLNKYWAFAGSKKRNAKVEVGQFLLVSLGGLVVNTAAASLFLYAIHPFPPIGLVVTHWPTVAALVGSAVGLAWNYVGYKTIVFHHKHPEMLPPA